ncbi:LysM peptidoglycan-binding domain-containing protein [Streptomyces sp. SID14478]|uniref:LysM peptidoglycan-binding domain-containing protein n=1 Tax=Streptomyces sp. SID14478 TaxID=2706073 RepID=UPI0013DF7029|nr:transglycosylase family protein [Streptomyces sp. SID14478]NEB80635.1 LysM peptidoglycan-binding domain-containing protein [Streptomyces sp. SID14478]
MLLSSKGKHRRPSKAVRVATLAGVAGAAVAVPLMGATSASAASTSEWDQVAQCESGGNWSINTGNGYTGGLQFSSSTWAAYGGTAYASSADQASKAQQISVAEKVLAAQGKGAWPSCGVGLSGASTGNSAPAPEAPQQSQPQQKTEQRADSSTTTRSEQRQQPQQESKKDTVTTPTGKKVEKGDGEYKVKTGDTLGEIASAHGTSWQKVFKLNKDIVSDADLIYPGQQLHLK